VRLACQTRPTREVSVEPLLAPSIAPAEAFGTDARQGREQELAVLFADLRGFTRMAENKLPYDVVFVLNRYFEAVGTAITRAGGVTNQFIGDGVMALVVSEDVARHAALDLSRFPAHDLTVRNRAGQIAVRVIDRVSTLPTT